MPKVLQKFKNQKASLLIEALLTVVILSVSLTIIIQSLMSALRTASYTSEYTKAILLSQNKMFEVVSQNPGERSSQQGAFDNPYEDYAYSLGIEDEGSQGLKKVTLEVAWNQIAKRKGITIETYLFEPPP